MDDGDAGRAQAGLLRQGMNNAGLRVPRVWRHYFCLGRLAAEIEIEAFLHHAQPLPPLERDMLAHAVNELPDHGTSVTTS